ncbi:hypothetical protein OGAPHI_002352 [Ogataea philodendri]|uniref:Uncharacterized protein n=1 Tax=Ogataea philodendri TaxID=1378263 RepID=A0A9P8T6Y9_9ASCO|nr:uncharacterized protein OGAPHI_002352 [Ogataea philodendri]KAH3668598.1 hypothetical protein OGAPHI_002352 [Ogataea philodendri]
MHYLFPRHPETSRRRVLTFCSKQALGNHFHSSLLTRVDLELGFEMPSPSAEDDTKDEAYDSCREWGIRKNRFWVNLSGWLLTHESIMTVKILQIDSIMVSPGPLGSTPETVRGAWQAHHVHTQITQSTEARGTRKQLGNYLFKVPTKPIGAGVDCLH